MQTGPSVRSTLTATVTTVWYVLVYGAPAVGLMAAADRWLAVPIVLWFSGYTLLLFDVGAARARVLEGLSEARFVSDGPDRRQATRTSSR